MPRRLSRIVLALCLAIATSPLLAAAGRRAEPRPAPAAIEAPAAGPLALLWGRLVALWGAEGCILDPNGARCAAANTTTQRATVPALDEGCVIDPNGRCVRNR